MKPRKLPTTHKLKSLITGGAALCLSLSFSAANEDPESSLREWKSQDGKFSIKASLKAFNRSTKRVTLQKENSTAVVVPLSKLSAADRSFVAAQSSKLPVTGKIAETTRIHGINWQPEMDNALAAAASEKKPLMWFRVLGELEGGM